MKLTNGLSDLSEFLEAHLREARIIFLIILLLNSVALGITITSASEDRANSLSPDKVAQRDSITVITSQNPIGKITAYDRDGTLLYENTTYDTYYDVDPHPSGDKTIVYTATNRRSTNRSVCADPCVRSVIEIVNLSTGDLTRLHSRYNQRPHNSEWHDVDRVNDNRYLIADMANNQVYIVNVSTGQIQWLWEAQQHFKVKNGGPFPGDWTHLNDVELLKNDRIMVSMRNQDQVIFIDKQTRQVIDEQTLGAEDAHEIIHEQHNPDYIPPKNGGPAVIVADSQNQRVVEYQRKSGSWERTWLWRDSEIAWPRDADRLPNGHTLIVDSHGNRVLEVNQNGNITWKVDVRSPYDAERLTPGDESTGGPSAQQADLKSRGENVTTSTGNTDQSIPVQVWMEIRSRMPNKLVNGLLFVLPPWIGVEEFMLILIEIGIIGLWGTVELWSAGIRPRWPIYQHQ